MKLDPKTLGSDVRKRLPFAISVELLMFKNFDESTEFQFMSCNSFLHQKGAMLHPWISTLPDRRPY